jgi:hypothetical protein
MCRRLLEELISDSFVLSLGFLSTAAALRRQLLRTKEVREIREAFRQGAITEEAIREFVSRLLAGFRVGSRFENEMALSALAVVLERRATDFAEEFLLDLAKLKLAEMPLCIRVARECLKDRVTITQNRARVFPPWTLPSKISFQQSDLHKIGSPESIPTIREMIDLRPTNAKA